MKARLRAFADRPLGSAVIETAYFTIVSLIVTAIYHRPFTRNEVAQAICWGCL